MNRSLAWAVVILLAAFALRVHALGAKSLWYDELRQIEVAQRPLSQLQPQLVRHSARPLDYVLTYYLLTAGAQEFWLRFPAVAWGNLAVALMFPLARRWSGTATAFAAMALMAAAPIGIQYAQELRPYGLYLLFTLISFWSLERALASPGLPAHPERSEAKSKDVGGAQARRGRWLWFALASVGGTLTHFFYTFVLTAQVMFVVGWYATHRRRLRWQSALAFGAAAAVGYGALLVGASPLTLLVFTQRFFGALAAAPFVGLTTDTGVEVPMAAAVNRSFILDGILPFYGGGGSAAALILFNGLALAGLMALAIRDRRRLLLYSLWLFAAPALVIFYLQYRQEFFALRYILFVLPVYLLLIAHGLASISAALTAGLSRLRRHNVRPRRQSAPRILVAIGLLGLLALDLQQVAWYYRKPKDDWRRVGAFLTANVRAGDIVAAPDVQAFIRFYAPAQPGAVLDANDRGPHEQALANAERFWFVWSDYTLVPIEETRRWVRGLPAVTFQLDPKIQVIFVHPGLTPAEMLAEAEQFTLPPPSVP